MNLIRQSSIFSKIVLVSFFILSSFLLIEQSVLANEMLTQCEENRSALDIGSGATKYKVFKINHCEKKIVSTLFEKQYPILFKENLNKDQNVEKNFSPEIFLEFETALKEVIEFNKTYKVVRFRGAATEAFRQSKNGAQFLAKLAEKENLQLTVISQDEEAQLGFKAAFLDSKSTDKKNKLMWDIGGGSMQIVLFDQNIFHSYLGKMASVSFKDLVINEVKKLDSTKINSPNPLSKTEVDAALVLARSNVKSIPPAIKEKISPDTEVVGVGGVFQFSLLGQLKKEDGFSLKDLKSLLVKRTNLNDEDFKSKYASTELTNIILVSGFMEELKIPQLKVRKVNLTEALVMD